MRPSGKSPYPAHRKPEHVQPACVPYIQIEKNDTDTSSHKDKTEKWLETTISDQY